jgi:hypothetical protein
MAEQQPPYGQSSGHQAYPVGAPYLSPGYGQPYPMMPPPKTARTVAWSLAIAGCLIVCLICAPVIGFVLINTFANDDATADVNIVECAIQQIGGVRTPMARIILHNSSSDIRNYHVTIAFDSAGRATQYARTVVNGVAPGQLATAEVDGSSPVGANVTCRVGSSFWYVP